ncbi:hypothetical protein [Streptomyces sp. NRRL WC-3549]|uniref:hypothetical protein n=1 Tax=Streptomyces sp. NRRL WC-3549 TaxID=1463925 RepID=UPI0004C4BD1B|nr:hypothetical protein [Streptomyces sp. NRRL WC-3549]
MSNTEPIVLEGIPVFTGNLATLDVKVTELSSAAESVATTTGDVHSSFGGLQAFYQAPEAEQLFATTKPVVDTGQKLKSDLTAISRALSTYSDEVYPLVEKLKEIKRDAGAFLVKINADDKWREDGDLVDENNHRRDEIRETWAAFQEAEITCYNKIVALVCGVPLKKHDGSDSKHQYGYDAETLEHVEGLPWGDPLVESIPGWQVWEHAWEFTKGFFVDGVWGTIKGLGTLVGFDGFDAAGQAWKGLAQLATGVAITIVPGAAEAFWTADEKDLPSWLRDSRTAVKETGKALLAWDQWGDNPSRAAGTVTFNVVTTVFTGGTGAAASGAGKAALAAKALTAAGKVGRIVDPMTYVFKGAGAGLSKIGDVMAGLKNLGKIETPPLPDNVFTLPDGWTRLTDGTLDVPAGATLPHGATRLPDGTVKLPEGTIALPEGTIKNPFDEGAAYADLNGNLYDQHGNLLQKGEDALKEQGKTADPNTPDHDRVETPVRQPVLVGAGARVGDAADDGMRMRDTGRVEGGLPGSSVGDRLPGSVANRLPSNAAPGDNLPTSGNTTTADGHSIDNTVSGYRDIPHQSPKVGQDPPTGASDNAATPANHAGGRTGSGGRSDLAAGELKRIQDEHVRKANGPDQSWFKEHYDELGRRRPSRKTVDGATLTQLTKDADGKWIATHDLPSGPIEVKFNQTPLGVDTIPAENLSELNTAAKNRRLSVDLLNAEKIAEKTPSNANQEALAKAQEAYATQLGNLPNNSKISETLGEKAARLHAIPHKFPEAEWTELPKTPNGANMFDAVYKLDEDGGYLIVEAKAPSGDLDWRQGRADPEDPAKPHLGDDGGAQGMRVKQGTKPYIRTILAEMTRRGDRDAEIAQELRSALTNRKLQYILVKANDNPGFSYTGTVIEHFQV